MDGDVMPVITEKDLQAWVRKAALTNGYLFYHTWNSMRSAKGYPDCTMLKKNRLIFAELKSNKGRVTAEQAAWLDALIQGGYEAYIWYPYDLDRIWEILTRGDK